MIVEPLRGPGPWSVEFPMSLTSLLLLVGGLALWGYTLWRWLSNSRNLTGRRLVTFLVLLVVLVPAQRFFAVSWAGYAMCWSWQPPHSPKRPQRGSTRSGEGSLTDWTAASR